MGPYAKEDMLTTLEGNIDNNPLSFSYTIVDLDEWFLAVAYIRPSTYVGEESKGRLYNTSGEETGILKDYKFKDNATACMIRALLFYDTTVNNNQFLYAPRLEPINGLEPSIEELLSLETPKIITFFYDTAGNQKLRKTPYTNSLSGKRTTERLSELYTDSDVFFEDNQLSLNDDIEQFKNTVVVSPNPTSSFLNFYWNQKYIDLVVAVTMSDISGKSVPIKYTQGQNIAEANLTQYPSGIYLVSFKLSDGKRLDTKIIRQ